MYMLNMVIILIVMYCNVVTAIDKIPTYLLRFNSAGTFAEDVPLLGHRLSEALGRWGVDTY